MQHLDVVAGLLFNQQQQILIAKRPPDKPHPGLWEFPGGKRELGEAALQALRRELAEEIGVQMIAALPLVERSYSYPDYVVHLQAWIVQAFHGQPQPLEGQALRWVEVNTLGDYKMPEANDFVMQQLLQQASVIPSRHD